MCGSALREETSSACGHILSRVPSLGDVAAVGQALVLAVRPGVAAPPAAAGVGPVRPVPPGVVPVHPNLAFAHAAHVQSHRIAPRRRVEQGLRVVHQTRRFRNTSHTYHCCPVPFLQKFKSLMEGPCAKSVAACRLGRPIPRRSFQSRCGGRAIRLSGRPAPGKIRNSA